MMIKREIEYYNNILDAIKQFEPNHPVINAYLNGYTINRNNSDFMMFEYNGKTIILPKNGIMMRYFRGEPEIYPSCKSSINRLEPFERVIAEVKKIEFVDIIKTFPAIIYAENDGHLVDYEALAQHYEMKSSVIDLTSDLIVAAFFATNRFDDKTRDYIPVESGSGVIWFYDFSMQRNLQDDRFKFTGLQPFKRTEEQCAFSFCLTNEEDFSDYAYKVHFKQDPRIGDFIKGLFVKDDKVTLFPKERVADISDRLRDEKSININALNKYRDTFKNNISDDIFFSNNVKIRDNMICVLTDDEKNVMRAEVEREPFGNKFITSRLSHKP